MVRLMRDHKGLVWVCLVALLGAMALAQVGRAEAGVTITNGEFLYLGMWDHATSADNTVVTYEGVPSPILWKKISDDLYLSEYLVDAQKWAESNQGGNWNNSPLRKWLTDTGESGGFFEASAGAFDTTERTILRSGVDGDTGAYVTVQEYNAPWNQGGAKFKSASGNVVVYWTRSSDSTSTSWGIADIGIHRQIFVNAVCGVRPALSLNLESVIFKSGSNLASPPVADAGLISNPYILYMASADVPSSDLDLSGSGNTLTVGFDRRAAHAYKNTAAIDDLKDRFTVTMNGSDNPVNTVAFTNGKIELTLANPLADGDVKLRYTVDNVTALHGVAFPETRTVLNSFVDQPVPAAPLVTTQPSDLSATVGGSATFTATAAGYPTPTYRWQESANGGSWTDLADGGIYGGTATDTLTLTGVALTHSGNRYRCIATNAQGEATSDAATLTVTEDATVYPATASFDLNAGGAAHRDVAVTLSPGTYLLTKITRGGADLTAGTNYTVSGDVYTIKREYLAGLSAGDYTFTFVMSGGANPALAVTVAETTTEITGVSANPATLPASGGESTISIDGTSLIDRTVTVSAFDGGTAAATASHVGPGDVRLSLPANASTTADIVYAIRASLDGGMTWAAPEAAVTVGRAPAQPSQETTPGRIAATVGGTAYEAEKQAGGSYLIVLPAGTAQSALNGLPLAIALPAGATISPDPAQGFDFSGGPAAFTITAQDGTTTEPITVDVCIATPQAVERAAVTADPEQCHVAITYKADGTLVVQIRLLFADGFDPAALERVSAELTHLSNVSFAYVDRDGNALPLARGVFEGDAHLGITATAADGTALESATLSQLTYWLEGDATEYRQAFAPPLKVSDMPISYEYDGPDPDPDPDPDPEMPGGVGGSGGCDAGVGLGLLVMLAGSAAAMPRK